MMWFRAHIRLGSRLALAALAIQLVLAFAHAHDTAFSGPGAPPSAAKSVASLSHLIPADRLSATRSAHDLADALPAPAHDDGPGDAACAICAVIAMANVLLIPPAPALPPHPAGNGPTLRLDLDVTDLAPIRTAFQPRAPPLS